MVYTILVLGKKLYDCRGVQPPSEYSECAK